MITIYSSTTCPKCKILKGWCEKENIVFTSINISEDLDAESELASQGIMTLPAVSYEGEFYSGDVKQLTDIIKNFSINK